MFWGDIALKTPELIAQLPKPSTGVPSSRFAVTVRTDHREFKPSGQKKIRIPKSSEDSHIADVWKVGKTVGADADDRDPSPNGDGTPGDGLTNYEEYRGFYENGKHIEGDPGVKEIFVRNRTGGLSQPGIDMFGDISAVKVHGTLREDELPADRVINRNHREAPHVVDQHGLIIGLDKRLTNEALAYGGPSTPKGITFIGVDSHVGKTWSSENIRVAVAHVLAHAVNVYHHGEGDSKVSWTMSKD